MTKYWRFLTSDLSQEEIADMEQAKKNLEKYEQIYTIFEYGSDLNSIMTTLETRVAQNNPSVPMTIYRKVSHLICLNIISHHTTPQRRSLQKWRLFSRHTMVSLMIVQAVPVGLGKSKKTLDRTSHI